MKERGKGRSVSFARPIMGKKNHTRCGRAFGSSCTIVTNYVGYRPSGLILNNGV
jgi:hypothetical protein